MKRDAAGDQIIQIGIGWSGPKKFAGERTDYVFNAFVNFKPLERFNNGSGVSW